MTTTQPRTPPRRYPPAAAAARGDRCTACRRTARQIVLGSRHLNVQAALAAASGDLATIWLIPQGRGFTEARFCAPCAPAGRIWPADCAKGCGAGPIVLLAADTLPGMPTDPDLRDRAIAHLQEEGWRDEHNGLLICPACSADGADPDGEAGPAVTTTVM